MSLKSFLRKIKVISAEEYTKEIVDFMNSTYAVACNDEFTLRNAFFANVLDPHDIFLFDSKNYPGSSICVRCDPNTGEINTNYMETHYAEPILEFMKATVAELFGDSRVIYDYSPGVPYFDADYTYTQQDFMEKEGASFEIYLLADSEWIDEKMQDKAAMLINEACKQVHLRLNSFTLNFMTELYDEDIKYHIQFDKKNYHTRIVKYVGYRGGDEVKRIFGSR